MATVGIKWLTIVCVGPYPYMKQ